MTVTYKWRDTGWARLKSEFIKMNSTEVVAGLVGDSGTKPHGDSGLTVGEVGIVNEFGSDDGHVPARSFMRNATRGRESEYQRIAAVAVREIINRQVSASKALEIVGKWAADKIRTNITHNTPPPNAEATVARKGHGRTLMDTGLLLASIGWQIVSAAGKRLGGGGGESDSDWLGGL